MRGLKDHEIQELVNVVRAELAPICSYGSLRESISSAVSRYLNEKDLRIDKKKVSNNYRQDLGLRLCISCVHKERYPDGDACSNCSENMEE